MSKLEQFLSLFRSIILFALWVKVFNTPQIVVTIGTLMFVGLFVHFLSNLDNR